MKLTPKQKAFADYYIISGNATESYFKAGYSVKSNDAARVNACKLLTNANIQTYIANIMAKKDKSRVAAQDEVLEFLTDLLRGKLTEQTPIVLQREFKIFDKEPSLRDRIKAAELLGKRYSLFTDKVQVDANVANVEYIAEWGKSE